MLPISYKTQIEQTPGVAAVAHAVWFGGIYKDPKDSFFAQLPVVPDEYLKMYPDFILPKQPFDARMKPRTACAGGRASQAARL